MRPVIRDSPRGSSIYVLDIANATKIYSGPRCPTHGGRYHACNTGMIKPDHDTRNGSETAEISITGVRALENDKMESVCGIISGAYESCIPPRTEPPTVIVLQIYVLIPSGQTFRDNLLKQRYNAFRKTAGSLWYILRFIGTC